MAGIIRKVLGEKNTFKVKHFLSRKQDNQLLKQRTAFYQEIISRGDLCFDVGANIGNRVEPFLNIGARVVAIEPQENCYQILKSRFGNRIELVTEGLGAEEAEKDFHISDTSTISSFSDEWVNTVKEGRFKEYTWNKTIRVKITTLDNLIERYGKPHFIKIDVEGYELDVLKGLNHKIDYISFEYALPEQLDKMVACIEKLKSIDGSVKFNYSKGESMIWDLNEWLPANEMISLVKSQKFIDTSFGDIYACNK